MILQQQEFSSYLSFASLSKNVPIGQPVTANNNQLSKTIVRLYFKKVPYALKHSYINKFSFFNSIL